MKRLADVRLSNPSFFCQLPLCHILGLSSVYNSLDNYKFRLQRTILCPYFRVFQLFL